MTADIPEFDVSVGEDGRVSFVHAPQARAYLRRLRQAEGEHLVLQIYPHRTKRSDRQNRGFHAMISPWAREGGHRIDDLKRDLLEAVFGTLEVTSAVTGEVRQVLAEPHTSKLTVGQFCELIDRALELAAEQGVMLVAPDEYLKAKEAAAKQAARKAKREAA